ncbi:MAG: hypothetical protein KKF68_03370 [Nanoarchaeota archaeon]|nr:hypothetical protein [Nanoarchaeota archaeon]
MEYIIGSKKEFYTFLDSIEKKDQIGILTHSDLDGIASAIFIEEILREKEINVESVNFMIHGFGEFQKKVREIKNRKISKLFILDLAGDLIDLDLFEALREEIDVFLIDHHEINKELQNKGNIIKTNTSECVAFVIYNLGDRLFDREKLGWLVCAAMISDMSYKNPENLRFIQEIYPELNLKNLSESVPKKISKIISSALTYYDDVLKIYDLVKKKDVDRLEKAYDIVEKDFQKYVKKFKENAEFYPEKNLYFYYFNPRFDIGSSVTTVVSDNDSGSTFIGVSDVEDDFVKINARNQGDIADMNQLVKKGIDGLKNASGGGHKKAAGARIMKKDLEKFKKNILS